MEKQPAENIKKSLERLQTLEKTGKYFFYASTKKIGDSFSLQPEAVFENVHVALLALPKESKKGYIYVFSKEDLSKPVFFVEI